MNRIFFYGNGNMAWALIGEFRKRGIPVSGVFGKSPERNRAFADSVGVAALANPEYETQPGDVLLISVKDDAIPVLAQKLRLPGRFVFHTAGSVDLEALGPVSDQIGVFYPLQRAVKGKATEFSRVPICLEASDPETLFVARRLAGQISDSVYEFSSEKRKMAHLAAVFVSNFPNFMLILGAEILKENGLPETLLNELVRETFSKALPSEAFKNQTGPARRADLKVISSHLKLLEKDPSKEAIYRLLTMEIMKRFYR